MIIGTPKEIKNHEYRVGLTPESARELVVHGHRVLVQTGALEMGHARALLPLAVPMAIALAKQAAEHGWSVREVEHRVQQLSAGKTPTSKKPTAAKPKPQADIVALERELSETLGTRIDVLHGRAGKGRLVIHYSDLESLDGVLERLRNRQ